jgi:hypothetical protein
VSALDRSGADSSMSPQAWWEPAPRRRAFLHACSRLQPCRRPPRVGSSCSTPETIRARAPTRCHGG